MANPSTFGQPSWGRWEHHPHPQPQQYNMMGSHQVQIYYGSPPDSPDMMAGQMMPPQYAVAPQYGPAYSSAPTQTQSAPVPQHIVMPYAGYDGLNDMPAATFIKQEPPSHHFESVPPPHMHHAFYAFSHREVKPSLAVLSPSSSRRGSNGSIMMDELRLTTPSKTIKTNKTYDPSNDVTFTTPVDQMMKVLHPEPKPESQLPTPGASPKSEHMADCSSPVSPCGPKPISAPSPSIASSSSDSKAKRYYCDGPDCDASFTQKVHLKTHKATHTGEKPYQCPYCPHSMSQAGNLNTHMNNHLGIRNFRCKYCPKEFTAKGNCDAHEKNIHHPNKYTCQLDQCGKKLSTVGNLKTHTNKFHQPTVEDLSMRFAQYQVDGYIPDEDRHLFDYFKMIFKNSNKGVKGRGKGRKVIKVEDASRKASKPTVSTDRRQKSHRDITGDTHMNAAVAAHLADRQRYYGV